MGPEKWKWTRHRASRLTDALQPLLDMCGKAQAASAHAELQELAPCRTHRCDEKQGPIQVSIALPPSVTKTDKQAMVGYREWVGRGANGSVHCPDLISRPVRHLHPGKRLAVRL